MAKPHELPYLPAAFELEQEILDQLSNRPGAQRCVVGRYELLLIAHELPKSGASEREAVAFWRREEGFWMDSQSGKGLRRLAELMERYSTRIKELEATLENQASAETIFQTARAAGPIARSSKNLTKAVEQALSQDEDSRELRSLRDRVREVERAAELLNQDARLKLDFLQAERNEGLRAATERLSAILFRLFLVAAVMLPVIAISVLFALHPGHPIAFWIVLAVALGSTGAAAYVGVFKNLRK